MLAFPASLFFLSLHLARMMCSFGADASAFLTASGIALTLLPAPNKVILFRTGIHLVPGHHALIRKDTVYIINFSLKS